MRTALLSACCLVLLGVLAPGVVAEPLAAPPADAPRARPIASYDVETPRIRVPKNALHPVTFKVAGRRKGWVVRTAVSPHVVIVGAGGEAPIAFLSNSPSPAVGDGRVYAGAGILGTGLSAFETRSGKHLWTAKLKDNGPSTVAVTPGRVVVNTESCTTYAITPSTGKVEWSREVGPHVSAAPTVVRDRVYTAHHVQGGGCALTAMRLDNGRVLWERRLERDAIGAPIHRGGRLFLTTDDQTLHCFNLMGGPLWSRKRAATSAPWAAAGALYVAEPVSRRRGSTSVARLDPATGDVVWSTRLEVEFDSYETTTTSLTEALRRATGRALPGGGWAADPPRPVVVGKRCYFALERDLTVLDAETGAIRDVHRLPRRRRFHAPPAVLGSRLLFATYEGLLLEIDPRSGDVERALELGHRVTTQPVVDGGRVFLMSEQLLFSIPWGDKDGPSWPQWSGTAERSGGVPVPLR